MDFDEAFKLCGYDIVSAVLLRHSVRRETGGYSAHWVSDTLTVAEIATLCGIQGYPIKPRSVARRVSLARAKLSDLGCTVMPCEQGWTVRTDGRYRPEVKNEQSPEVA